MERSEESLDTAVGISLATLLAHLLLNEIDPPTLEMLRRAEVLDVLEKLQPGCRDYLLDREWGEDAYEEAAVEYCRLFILPTGAPPYANAWLGGDPMVNGPRIAAQIAAVMNGLGIPEVEDRQPRDHLGTLLGLAAAAWQAGPEAEPWLLALSEELLSPAARAFSKDLGRKTENPLYLATSRLLNQFVLLLPRAASPV